MTSRHEIPTDDDGERENLEDALASRSSDVPLDTRYANFRSALSSGIGRDIFSQVKAAAT
jgi:hypothetical protein